MANRAELMVGARRCREPTWRRSQSSTCQRSALLPFVEEWRRVEASRTSVAGAGAPGKGRPGPGTPQTGPRQTGASTRLKTAPRPVETSAHRAALKEPTRPLPEEQRPLVRYAAHRSITARRASSASDRKYARVTALPTVCARAISARSRSTFSCAHQSRKVERQPCTVASSPRRLWTALSVMSLRGTRRRRARSGRR